MIGSPSEPAVQAAARKALADAPEPHTAGPGPAPDEHRHAYLGLLKLCLCDLAGASTMSVGRMEDGAVASRELTDDQRRLRAVGMDWPLQGLTMIGLDRLDDLQSCVETIVSDGVQGDLIEAGAWRGGASILIRATLDSLGATDRTVWVADSFEGFPVADRRLDAEDQWDEMDYLAVPLEEVQANFARLGCERGVKFLPGFFADTLPTLGEERWSVIRLDGDTYEATLMALDCLYPHLSVGGYVIVDDYGALERCRAAVDEFRDRFGIDEPLEQVDWTCVRWRCERSIPNEPPAPMSRPGADGRRLGAAPRRARMRVPTLDELALRRELAQLGERLAAAEAELARLRRSPLAAGREWLRRKLHHGTQT